MVVKLVAFADVHDRFDAVTRILERTQPVDLIVIAGDITTNGTPADVERAIQSWRPFAPNLLAVAGNMDSPDIDDTLERLGVSINGQTRVLDNVAFLGCSAAPVSIGTPYEIPESEIARRLDSGFARAAQSRHLVLVPHAPPHGAVDLTSSGVNAGSRSVRQFIERIQPLLVLCGHIHEARGQTRIGQSHVVNCGPARAGHHVVAEIVDDSCRVHLG
jgi:uncharacterized protein